MAQDLEFKPKRRIRKDSPDEEPVFRPKRRIVITAEDIKSRHEVDLTSVDTEHAFLKPDFLAFLEENFPQLIDRIKASALPKISENPDYLEQWESGWILKRKQKMEIESNWAYLARLLYEETFSVNQNPGTASPPMEMGMPGVTVGGLISHFMFQGAMNQATVESSVEAIPQDSSPSLGKFVTDFKKSNPEDYYKKLNGILDIIGMCTNNGSRMLTGFPHRLKTELIERPSEKQSYKDFESIGFRLLAMLSSEPQMLKQVEDEDLKARFEVKPNAEISRAQLIVIAWHKSHTILTPSGTFAGTDQYNVKKAIENLLYLRTRPEMQVFFKFLSPSGYINEKKPEK